MFDEAVADGVATDISEVVFQVALIANGVFPETALPDRAFSFPLSFWDAYLGPP
jgi:hypothetical protein